MPQVTFWQLADEAHAAGKPHLPLGGRRVFQQTKVHCVLCRQNFSGNG